MTWNPATPPLPPLIVTEPSPAPKMKRGRVSWFTRTWAEPSGWLSQSEPSPAPVQAMFYAKRPATSPTRPPSIRAIFERHIMEGGRTPEEVLGEVAASVTWHGVSAEFRARGWAP